jgi:hypothetical protein
MRPALGILILFGGLAGCDAAPTDSSPAASLPPGSAPAFQVTTITVSQSFPVDIAVFIDCANGGAGELVALTGELHDLFHVTMSGGGRFVLKLHDQPEGISGVGEITGDVYHATGVTQETVTSGVIGSTDTFVNNFRIIGPGPGNNFLIHETFHVTVNANGTLTATVDNFSAECK